jgi:membrane protease YdiL (CAAX protease family)
MGGAFVCLFMAQGNVIAPFAAHLALNLAEFLFAWLA